MRVTFLNEDGKYFEVNESGATYYRKKEITEAEYKQATESPYYYQLIINKGDVLDSKYICCGLVNERSKMFYTEYFLHHDTRCGNTEVGYIEKLVIVKGFRGNVAERDGIKIEAEDIVEEYTK